jgi:hypothetical protein
MSSRATRICSHSVSELFFSLRTSSQVQQVLLPVLRQHDDRVESKSPDRPAQGISPLTFQRVLAAHQQ